MINFILVLILPFLIKGIAQTIKTKALRESGAGIFASYFEFIKLMKKNEVIDKNKTFIFQIAPSINLACSITAALLLTFIHFDCDFIVFCYILCLGRFFSYIASADTKNSITQMGASLKMAYCSFIPFVFFLLTGSIAAISGTYSFSAVSNIVGFHNDIDVLICTIVVISLLLLMIIDTSAAPIDNLDSCDETSIIEKGCSYEYSGVNLAFLKYSDSIKTLLYIMLITNIFARENIFAFMSIAIVYSIFTGIIEALAAKINAAHIFKFLVVPIALALFLIMALVLFVVNKGGLIS